MTLKKLDFDKHQDEWHELLQLIQDGEFEGDSKAFGLEDIASIEGCEVWLDSERATFLGIFRLRNGKYVSVNAHREGEDTNWQTATHRSISCHQGKTLSGAMSMLTTGEQQALSPAHDTLV